MALVVAFVLRRQFVLTDAFFATYNMGMIAQLLRDTFEVVVILIIVLSTVSIVVTEVQKRNKRKD